MRYEIPREVVAEAIVNAVAHRDYTSNGSVQVMLFADRLEVWNPGRLPQSLTLAMLREPHGSVPANPLLVEPLYLVKYIERMGTGTSDMIRLCRAAGLREPGFAQRDGFVTTVWREVRAEGDAAVTPPVTPHDTPYVAPQGIDRLPFVEAGPILNYARRGRIIDPPRTGSFHRSQPRQRGWRTSRFGGILRPPWAKPGSISSTSSKTSATPTPAPPKKP